MQWMMLGAAMTAMSTGAAAAADYVVIPLSTTVNRPADVVWAKVSGDCDIGAWLKIPCVITAGQAGSVGAVRRIADRIDEVFVARTARSYTYTQPKSPIDYHGTVEARDAGGGRTTLTYTLIYDQEPMKTPEARLAEKTSRTERFTAILATMKTIAEAP